MLWGRTFLHRIHHSCCYFYRHHLCSEQRRQDASIWSSLMAGRLLAKIEQTKEEQSLQSPLWIRAEYTMERIVRNSTIWKCQRGFDKYWSIYNQCIRFQKTQSHTPSSLRRWHLLSWHEIVHSRYIICKSPELIYVPRLSRRRLIRCISNTQIGEDIIRWSPRTAWHCGKFESTYSRPSHCKDFKLRRMITATWHEGRNSFTPLSAVTRLGLLRHASTTTIIAMKRRRRIIRPR